MSDSRTKHGSDRPEAEKAGAGRADSTPFDLLNALRIGSNDRFEEAARAQTMRSNPRWIWLLGLLACIAVWFWFAADSALFPETGTSEAVSASEPNQSAQLSYALEPREQTPATLISTQSSTLDATGYITARRQATVSSKITGKVEIVLVEEGDSVKAGDLLARLDDGLLKAQFRLSESQVSAAKSARLELEVDLVGARRTFERVQLLFSKSLVSEAELDLANTALQAVYARLSHNTSQITVAKNRMRLQQQLLTDTEIRAPFDGVVISKAAQAGEMISPISAGGGFTRTGICYLVDMSSLEIEVDVSESNINRVFAGQRVVATLNSYKDWQIPAQVITIIPAADRNRATIKVRIKILKMDQRILPDMGVRVAFYERDS